MPDIHSKYVSFKAEVKRFGNRFPVPSIRGQISAEIYVCVWVYFYNIVPAHGNEEIHGVYSSEK